MKAALLGIATHFPQRRLTNEQLSAELGGDWTPQKIFAKTGIRNRFVVGEGECASDLAVAACQKLFNSGISTAEEIDFLLFCTQSPDYYLPATACTLQQRLGLPTSCGSLDFNQGCSGFVYGLALAKGLVESGSARKVLLVTAETYSKFLNPRDRSVRTIFGDGAAATLVTAVPDGAGMVGPFVLGTDGRGARSLVVPAGGMRRPSSSETALEEQDASGNWRSEDNLYMDGPAIFTFTLAAVPPAVARLLTLASLSLDQVDYFVFHQASRFMLDHLRAKLKIPPPRFAFFIEQYGNTVSSTIPIALDQARALGAISPGARVMLVGFGVGLSWAATVVTVPDCPYWRHHERAGGGVGLLDRGAT